MTDRFLQQNILHHDLDRYVNHAYRSRRDYLLLLAAPGVARRRGAAALAARYRALQQAPAVACSERLVVEVPVYTGSNAAVQRMRAFLERHLSEDLRGAYVHGSLGSGEEVAYSDFDGLVVLKDEVMVSPHRLARVARDLYRARALMYAFDPLQHHGWFVLTELDLGAYCEAYFPAVLFRHARSLLPGPGERLTLARREARAEMDEAFAALVRTVSRRLRGGRPPANLYELKGLLSSFMLLPALYVQARDGAGVWKADSFERARVDFALEAWYCMEVVSAIRRDWHYALSPLRRWALGRPGPLAGRLRRRVAPLIPPDLNARLTPGLYAEMARLTDHMRARLATPVLNEGVA